uniref:Uncharacterized protein n=1 Tax=Rhizophora mucronata TaxID=61149 RepID=A0A2P2R0N8_RHIMU
MPLCDRFQMITRQNK